MKSLVYKALLAAAFFSAASAARAQDHRFYIVVGVGATAPVNTSLNVNGIVLEETGRLTTHTGNGSIGYGIGPSASLALGVPLRSRLSAEAALTYSGFDATSFSDNLVAGDGDSESGTFKLADHVTIAALLANLVTTPHLGRWQFSLGGGIGAAYVDHSLGDPSVTTGDPDGVNSLLGFSRISFAADALARVTYPVGPALNLGAQYRFLWVNASAAKTSDDGLTVSQGALETHSLEVVLVRRF